MASLSHYLAHWCQTASRNEGESWQKESLTSPYLKSNLASNNSKTEIWANGQRDGRTDEYRWALCSTQQSLANALYFTAVQ